MIEFLDPTDAPVFETFREAPAPDRKKALVAGVVNNGKWNSDIVLGAALHVFQEELNIARVVQITKASFAHGLSDGEVKRLRESCDFVIAGVGD